MTRRSAAWLVVVALAGVVAAVVINAWLVTVAQVESASMTPTIESGETVVVWRPGEVRRGDVVGFDGRGSFVPLAHPGVTYVKRVIGLGGDRVACCDAEGRLLVNGVPLTEPYVAPTARDDVAFDVVVPEGKMWVMGDNRVASADSRAHLGDPGGGFVPLTRVEGRVVAVLAPPDRARMVSR